MGRYGFSAEEVEERRMKARRLALVGIVAGGKPIVRATEGGCRCSVCGGRGVSGMVVEAYGRPICGVSVGDAFLCFKCEGMVRKGAEEARASAEPRGPGAVAGDVAPVVVARGRLG